MRYQDRPGELMDFKCVWGVKGANADPVQSDPLLVKFNQRDALRTSHCSVFNDPPGVHLKAKSNSQNSSEAQPLQAFNLYRTLCCLCWAHRALLPHLASKAHRALFNFSEAQWKPNKVSIGDPAAPPLPAATTSFLSFYHCCCCFHARDCWPCMLPNGVPAMKGMLGKAAALGGCCYGSSRTSWVGHSCSDHPCSQLPLNTLNSTAHPQYNDTQTFP
eukprot:1152055-Pelagomonas_calceolata.AAC.9